jgi:energy-coupling factor transport system ATP-binding protein
MLKLDHVSFSYTSYTSAKNAKSSAPYNASNNVSNNISNNVLTDVSLTLEEGSFVALLGANGSGKSTLSKLLNAILIPSSGEVFVDELLTSNPANTYAVRSKVGLVFQNPDSQIICDTVEDEIAFGLENMGLPVAEMRQRLDSCLELTGLLPLKDINPQRLSGGQKQMVCIASVLAMRPKYLVLDEATSMLDPQGRKLVLDFVHRLNQEFGLAILLITHNLEECAKANKVVLLEKGRVAFEGSVKDLVNKASKPLADRANTALADRASKPCDFTLRLPLVTQLTDALIAKGLSLPPEILTVDEFCTSFEPLLKTSENPKLLLAQLEACIKDIESGVSHA